jgi:glycerate 2-kinase
MNGSEIVKQVFLETMRDVDVETVTRSLCRCKDGEILVGDFAYQVESFRRVIVIAIGKASRTMWEGLVPQLERQLHDQILVESIVVGPNAPRPDGPGFRYYPGSHPFPDEHSRKAAEHILEVLLGTNEQTLVFFLISGGASAMVEKPLDLAMSDEDCRSFYQALVHSGLPIAKINALRKHFSLVKGGRLALAAHRATQCTLLISDAPPDMLHIIGSGPSFPDPSTIAECREIIETNRANLRFSERVFRFFDEHLVETPKKDDAAFRNSSWLSMLSSDDLVKSASRLANALGYRVAVDNGCDDWDYRDAATYLMDRFEQLASENVKVCLVSSGELSVPLSVEHGTGGRNQQFVLECARLLAMRSVEATVLSAGSDGIDGNSPAAGAVCDRNSWQRAAGQGLDPENALRSFDSYPLFQALDDVIVTGPAGNNLRDLRILLTTPAGHTAGRTIKADSLTEPVSKGRGMGQH